MESRPVFRNLSPLDHRYSVSRPALFERLSALLSEEAVVRTCLECERALLEVHIARFFSPTDQSRFLARLEEAFSQIRVEEVYEEESRTQHNIRALVNVIKRYVNSELSPYVHLGATSADILDTAQSLRYRRVVSQVLVPLGRDLLLELLRLVEAHADTVQCGRTHGQWAVPLTFGYFLAGYLSRLGQSFERLQELSEELCGKWAGAVGAYNALRLLDPNPRSLEADYLERLGLRAGEHATQLVQPEPVLRLLLEINVAFGIVANLADDLRHLQRSEIAEVREAFADTQVGSSTMPQKRNPWNCEHVKSLWKAFVPRAITFFMDQISEHQRDLTNSASGRFVAEFFSGFALAVDRMISVLRGLQVDSKKMLHNLQQGSEQFLAEAIYILLALEGDAEAHETVRRLTLECERSGKTLLAALQGRPDALQRLERGLARVGLGAPAEFLSQPALYRGIAAERALEIARTWRRRLESWAADSNTSLEQSSTPFQSIMDDVQKGG